MNRCFASGSGWHPPAPAERHRPEAPAGCWWMINLGEENRGTGEMAGDGGAWAPTRKWWQGVRKWWFLGIIMQLAGAGQSTATKRWRTFLPTAAHDPAGYGTLEVFFIRLHTRRLWPWASDHQQSTVQRGSGKGGGGGRGSNICDSGINLAPLKSVPIIKTPQVESY